MAPTQLLPSCRHRAIGQWGRAWDTWLASVVASFAVLETVALVRDGLPGTLSFYLRHSAGLEQHCRHRHAGRIVILAACGWLAVHLGWGVLGLPHRTT